MCTKVIVRLTRDPAAYRTMLGVFNAIRTPRRRPTRMSARNRPAAAGMVDSGDHRSGRSCLSCGFPLDAAAVLLVEVDGLKCAVDEEAACSVAICRETGARPRQFRRKSGCCSGNAASIGDV